ncbi:MAG: DJ-1/PfpI family protein [Anaerolineae bacterium]|nr:DJ-1/PfpI family protein [Anaerolineae bacterium]
MPGKKVIMVLPPYGFDREVFETIRRALEGRGHQITTSCIVPGAANSGDGYYVPIELRVVDIKYYQYDAFIFIGGPGATAYFDNDYVLKLAKDVKFKPVGATGSATVILARAEGLKKKKATGPYQFAGMLIEAGAQFTNEPMEVDDKVYTLKEPALAINFANAIAEALES